MQPMNQSLYDVSKLIQMNACNLQIFNASRAHTYMNSRMDVRAMDALEFLKDDHRKGRALFDEAEAAETFKQRRRAFDSIKYEIEAHAFIEEGIFYPSFRKYDGFTDILEQSFHDHQVIKNLLQELNEMGHVVGRAGESQFEEKLKVLRKTVEAHVHEEETRFFSSVRKVMGPSERERLGCLMQSTRDELEWAA